MRLAHAATLGFEGRGVLLAGSGGSGKSGTTLAGIAQGMNSVGDDYVLLDRGPSRQAHAVYTTMKQDVRGLHRAKLDPGQIGGVPNWQNKIEFDPTKIHHRALCDRMEIVSILLPKIAHQSRTTIERARPAEAMLALAPSGLFQMPGCAASGVRFFSDFVRGTPVYHLCLSENPLEIADTIYGSSREVLAGVISAIMPAYNTSPYIEQAIRSLLLQQNDELRLDIIVIDDGSSDDTVDVVRGMASGIPKFD
jgi:hypothetical protein